MEDLGRDCESRACEYSISSGCVDSSGMLSCASPVVKVSDDCVVGGLLFNSWASPEISVRRLSSFESSCVICRLVFPCLFF